MRKITTATKSSTTELRAENGGRHEPYLSTAQEGTQELHRKPQATSIPTTKQPQGRQTRFTIGSGDCVSCWPHEKLRSGLFLYVETFLGVANDQRLPSVQVYKYNSPFNNDEALKQSLWRGFAFFLLLPLGMLTQPHEYGVLSDSSNTLDLVSAC